MSVSSYVYLKLKSIVGSGNLSKKPEDLLCYAYDSTRKTCMPDVVIFPGSTEEVSEIVKLANRENIPVVPRGGGSGTTGGALAVSGGLVLVMSRLNRIIHVDTDNLTADVEPGVVTGMFHSEVERLGLFYPPDPASSAFCTLGGNLSECAGGPRAVKYGVTRDYVLGLTAVLPDGSIVKTGVRTAKGVVGYDLTRLIVGSEGTLGIITRMTLRLLPLPEAVKTMLVTFGEMERAAETVSEIIRSGLVPRTCEYLDNSAIRCAEDYAKAGFPVDAGAVLILEVDGSELEAAAALAKLEELCRKMGALELKMAESGEEAADLWKLRKSVSPSLYMFGPDKINEDIVVPRSRIPQMVKKIRELGERSGLTMVSFGHAGDGNIHVNVMLDKSKKADLLKAERVVEELFTHTLELGGTISGEHGVGITKKFFIDREIGSAELDAMRAIKKAWDPRNVLNPGKIFDL